MLSRDNLGATSDLSKNDGTSESESWDKIRQLLPFLPFLRLHKLPLYSTKLIHDRWVLFAVTRRPCHVTNHPKVHTEGRFTTNKKRNIRTVPHSLMSHIRHVFTLCHITAAWHDKRSQLRAWTTQFDYIEALIMAPVRDIQNLSYFLIHYFHLFLMTI